MDDTDLLLREFADLDRKRRRGLGPEELKRWMALKRALARQLQPGVSDAQADQRDSIRVPTRLSATFANLRELGRSWMTNLSRGGVFVATDQLVEIGTCLTLRLSVAESGEELELLAEVVSHNVGPRFERRRGMGMRFLQLSPEMEKKLDDLYDAALRREVEKRREP